MTQDSLIKFIYKLSISNSFLWSLLDHEWIVVLRLAMVANKSSRVLMEFLKLLDCMVIEMQFDKLWPIIKAILQIYCK